MAVGSIESRKVPGWQPYVHIAASIDERDRALVFTQHIAAPFDAPPIVYDEPQPLLVTGARWVVVTERTGLVERTTFLIPHFSWFDAFRQMGQPAPVRRWAGPMLIAGCRYRDNHFHWLFQSIGTVMMARHLGLDDTTPVLLPPMTDRLREPLALLGIRNPVEELPDDAIAILSEGVLSTACGGDHGLHPHPAMLELFKEQARRVVGGSRAKRKIYLSRRGAANRRVPLNEDEAIMALEARGFEAVAAGELPLVDQIRLFREAAIIVAPHGAALSNLAWTEDGADGPVVIELLQENYTSRAFARMAQVKQLNYHAIICECVERADLLIDTRGRIDLPLLLGLIDQL